MNPLMLYRSLPYIIIAALAAALVWTTNLYLDKRDQLAALEASVQALGQAAQKVVEDKKVEYAANLQTVKDNHEKLAPSIRSAAVANYRRTHPVVGRVLDCPSSGAVSGLAAGQPVHDDPESERISVEPGFIQACADDANKVTAWQHWGQLNHLPVR